MKKNASIFVKIWLSVSVLFLGYIVSMIMVQATGGKIRNRLGYVSGSLFPAAQIGEQIVANFEEQLKLYEDAVILGGETKIESAKEVAQNVQTLLQQVVSLKDINQDRIDEIRKIEQALAEFTNRSNDIYKKMAEGDLSDEMIQKADALSKIKENQLKAVKNLSTGLSRDYTDEISSIIDYYAKQQKFNMILFAIVLSVSGVIIWLVTKRSIVSPVTRAINQLKRVAYEIDSTSTQVADASQSLAEGSSEQAASIEETSSSLEEMSSMTRQNADYAAKANNLMKQTSGVIDKANTSMGELTDSMDKISKASEETSKIIKTIDEIAFQTNLLALNAAVEAARAGEAGAGFAVVADEVRNLAMRAADAAKNTSVLIEDTVKRIKEGTKMVFHTNEDFSEVSKSSGTIKDLIEEIAAASNEQAQGIEQINRAVTEMDKIVQQNAAGAEQSSSASQEMNAQADNLNHVVFSLVNVIGGQIEQQRSVSELGSLFKKSMYKRKASDAPAAQKSKKTIALHNAVSSDDDELKF